MPQFAPYSVLFPITRAVLLGIDVRGKHIPNTPVRFESCPRLMKVTVTTDNHFEAWRLYHRLKSKGFKAICLDDTHVATDASKSTVRRYYEIIKD